MRRWIPVFLLTLLFFSGRVYAEPLSEVPVFHSYDNSMFSSVDSLEELYGNTIKNHMLGVANFFSLIIREKTLGLPDIAWDRRQSSIFVGKSDEETLMAGAVFGEDGLVVAYYHDISMSAWTILENVDSISFEAKFSSLWCGRDYYELDEEVLSTAWQGFKNSLLEEGLVQSDERMFADMDALIARVEDEPREYNLNLGREFPAKGLDAFSVHGWYEDDKSRASFMSWLFVDAVDSEEFPDVDVNELFARESFVGMNPGILICGCEYEKGALFLGYNQNANSAWWWYSELDGTLEDTFAEMCQNEYYKNDPEFLQKTYQHIIEKYVPAKEDDETDILKTEEETERTSDDVNSTDQTSEYTAFNTVNLGLTGMKAEQWYEDDTTRAAFSILALFDAVEAGLIRESELGIILLHDSYVGCKDYNDLPVLSFVGMDGKNMYIIGYMPDYDMETGTFSKYPEADTGTIKLFFEDEQSDDYYTNDKELLTELYDKFYNELYTS